MLVSGPVCLMLRRSLLAQEALTTWWVVLWTPTPYGALRIVTTMIQRTSRMTFRDHGRHFASYYVERGIFARSLRPRRTWGRSINISPEPQSLLDPCTLRVVHLESRSYIGVFWYSLEQDLAFLLIIISVALIIPYSCIIDLLKSSGLLFIYRLLGLDLSSVFLSVSSSCAVIGKLSTFVVPRPWIWKPSTFS